MNSLRRLGSQVRVFRGTAACVFTAMCALAAAGQSTPEPAAAPEGGNPLLTLGTPMLRSTMDRMNLAWVVPEKLPDFRLKIDRPTWESFSQSQMDARLRGVEIRLPMEGFWVGYEKTTEDEVPRVTLSIQRGF